MLKLNTIVFLVALSVMAGVHLMALQLYLYWRYWWLDIPMHIIGGSAVALGVFAYRDLRFPFYKALVNKNFGVVITIVIFVMIAWELFELWAGVPMLDNYVFDTSIDLIMGFVGGLLGYYVATSLDKL